MYQIRNSTQTHTKFGSQCDTELVQFIQQIGTEGQHSQDTPKSTLKSFLGWGNKTNAAEFYKLQGVTTKVTMKSVAKCATLTCTELCASKVNQTEQWHQMGEGKSDAMNSPSSVAQVAGTSPSLMTPSAVVTSPRPTIISVADQITFHTRAME